jgi:hypothetical protein
MVMIRAVQPMMRERTGDPALEMRGFQAWQTLRVSLSWLLLPKHKR